MITDVEVAKIVMGLNYEGEIDFSVSFRAQKFM
jgi:hypothetical protein